MKNLGELINNRRKELKLSLRQVADMTGLSHTYVMKLEKSQSVDPRVDDLAALASALGLPLSTLMAAAGHTSGESEKGMVPMVKELKGWPEVIAKDNVEAMVPISGVSGYTDGAYYEHFYYRMPDDSMAPTIRKGDALLMQRWRVPVNRGIYAMKCACQEKPFVCRFFNGHDSTAVLDHDNPDVDPCNAKIENLTVISKVVGMFRFYK